MNVNERIIDGIKRGVWRHWRYTKNLLRIKPEYLLTISVADALTDGFEDISGLDLEIKLEEPTKAICADLIINALGFNAYFKSAKHKVGRKGKVDIYVKHNAKSWIVELKGFDPSEAEINKEIIRLLEFLSANGGNNKCGGCFLAFPTATDRKSWIEGKLAKVSYTQSFQVSVSSERVETEEDPEDGIPVYYVNCIAFTASDAEPVVAGDAPPIGGAPLKLGR
jgi:hypothetical protein